MRFSTFIFTTLFLIGSTIADRTLDDFKDIDCEDNERTEHNTNNPDDMQPIRNLKMCCPPNTPQGYKGIKVPASLAQTNYLSCVKYDPKEPLCQTHAFYFKCCSRSSSLLTRATDLGTAIIQGIDCYDIQADAKKAAAAKGSESTDDRRNTHDASSGSGERKARGSLKRKKTIQNKIRLNPPPPPNPAPGQAGSGAGVGSWIRQKIETGN